MTGATLHGTVNPNMLETDVSFEWGAANGTQALTPPYTNTVVAKPSPVSGVSSVLVQAALTNLLPNTLYHYRVVASNTEGTIYGADVTFTTAEISIGDINDDGAINLIDARLCGQIAAGSRSATTAEQEQADVDEDGDVDMADVIALSEFILGLREVLP
jgi:hypothetical protein